MVNHQKQITFAHAVEHQPPPLPQTVKVRLIASCIRPTIKNEPVFRTVSFSSCFIRCFNESSFKLKSTLADYLIGG